MTKRLIHFAAFVALLSGTLASVPYEGEILLAIGTPGENFGGNANVGVVQLVFPMAEDVEGLTSIHQNVAGVPDTNEAHDELWRRSGLLRREQ